MKYTITLSSEEAFRIIKSHIEEITGLYAVNAKAILDVDYFDENHYPCKPTMVLKFVEVEVKDQIPHRPARELFEDSEERMRWNAYVKEKGNA